MFGIIVAVIYAAVLHFMNGESNVSAYLSATNFLFWWYVITSSIVGVMMLFVTFVISSASAAVGGAAGEDGGNKGKAIGALAGLAVGGGVSALLIAVQAVRCGSLIAGSWLLHNAVNFSGEWDNGRLIWGGLLILVGILMSRGTGATTRSGGERKIGSTNAEGGVDSLLR